ncbi:MAG: ribbon-helix-helix protein, CopG family [archaeon]
MQSGKINRILEKYKDVFDALENYDRTRTLPFQRKRIDITLSVGTISRLKELRKETGKPISKIIEESIEKRAAKSKPHHRQKILPEQISPEEPVPSYIC